MNKYRNWLKQWKVSSFEEIKDMFHGTKEEENINETTLEKHIHLFQDEKVSLCLTMSIEKVYARDEHYTISFECNGAENGEWNTSLTETLLSQNEKRAKDIQRITDDLIQAVKEKIHNFGLEKELKVVSYIEETVEDALSA